VLCGRDVVGKTVRLRDFTLLSIADVPRSWLRQATVLTGGECRHAGMSSGRYRNDVVSLYFSLARVKIIAQTWTMAVGAECRTETASGRQ